MSIPVTSVLPYYLYCHYRHLTVQQTSLSIDVSSLRCLRSGEMLRPCISLDGIITLRVLSYSGLSYWTRSARENVCERDNKVPS